jgi:hypothetical protein
MSTDSAPAGTGMPAGPWLTVLGMHRSGTSALTGALGALGFGTPARDDRMDWPESNPEHWESSSLTVYDDDVLADLGGSWDAPPELPPGWETGASIRSTPRPAAVAAGAFPEPGPIVWKDPRLCLLLPYWLRFLPHPPACVLIWRSPLGVADSLRRRDGMEPAHGIALWERYNRSALGHLVGLDTYLCRYESLVTDPAHELEAVAAWLHALPQFAGAAIEGDTTRAVESIAGLAPAGPSDDDDLLLTPQRDLVDLLTSLDGGHRPLESAPLGGESPWTTALLAARRGSRTREVAGLESRIADKQRTIDNLQASMSWRATAPLRAVVARARGRGR